MINHRILLTVCKSLRNRISVTKPAPIPIGAKLIHAKSSPKRSPENPDKTLSYSIWRQKENNILNLNFKDSKLTYWDNPL